jgi:hypothetical protein
LSWPLPCLAPSNLGHSIGDHFQWHSRAVREAIHSIKSRQQQFEAEAYRWAASASVLAEQAAGSN